MQHLEVSGAARRIYIRKSLGVKGIKVCEIQGIESGSAKAGNRNPAVSGYVGV